MKKIINIFTYEPSKGVENNAPSLFEPDQTMSIRTIMERYARGLPLAEGMNKNPVYLGEDEELPDLRKLDLVDIQEMQEQAVDEVKTIKEKLSSQAKEAKEREKAAKEAAKEKPEQNPKEPKKPAE
jgi:hypothetical protein